MSRATRIEIVCRPQPPLEVVAIDAAGHRMTISRPRTALGAVISERMAWRAINEGVLIL